jgi:ketosteroid isomerase-like protein
MKIAHMIVALAIVAAPAVSAQAPDSKQKPAPPAKAAGGSVEQTLIKMENDALAALLKRDVAAFGGIFADDAVMITPDANVQTKAQLLADVKSGDLVIQSSEISEMKVRTFGDTAVVTYITNDKGKYKGQDVSGRYRWTDVFARRAGKWQIVAGQGTQIPPPRK